MSTSAKRAVVTGGTGFVGANLTRRLLGQGHSVYLLVRPGYAHWRLDGIASRVHLCEVDLWDEPNVGRIVGQIRPEWVFHLATHGAYPFQSDIRQMMATNIVGTINLVQACVRSGFEAFVNTGSSSEYGFCRSPASESTLLEPNSYYAVTKAAASLFCRYTAQSQGVHMPTLRLYSVFGPFEEPSRLVPTLIVKGLRKQLPKLASPGVARDFVYVDDVSEAYISAATSPGQEPGAIYNVGTGVQTSLADAVEAARRLLAIAEEPEWDTMANRLWDTSVWVADIRKIRSALGWVPRRTFEEGFRLTVDWLRRRPSLLRFYEDSIRL